MAKFLLGIVVGIVVAVFGLFIIVLAIGRLFATKQPSISANSVLVVNLQGVIPEAAPVDIEIPFLQQRGTPTIRDLWTSLHAAAKDSNIKAVLLEPEGLAAGPAQLQELNADLAELKKSGKPVYAFLQHPSWRDYYFASVADKIYLSPDDMLDVKGFQAQLFFLKDALDKVGINFQVDHIGAYKDAGDVFTRTNMTPQTREVLNAYLDQIYNDFANTVGQGRHKTAADVKTLIDQGPFNADQAKASGLVDDAGYEDQAFSDLKKKTGTDKLNKAGIRSYVKATPGSGDRIALLVGEGEITPGEDGASSEARITYSEMERAAAQIKDDSSIKGVILRVDSPGGDAIASDEILHAMKLLAGAKPLVISFSDLAASGGYYLSMTGNPIVSYPDTITGSIGVLYARPNIQGLLKKIGVDQDSVSRGKLAGLDSLTEPLSDAAQQKLHEMILDTYDQFVSHVARARRKTFDQIQPLAQGRVWTGAEARQNGLVDDLGGLDRAVALVRQQAHLSAQGPTNLVLYPPKRTLLQILTASSNESVAETAINMKLHRLLPGVALNSYLHGGLLRLMPYQVTIR